MTVLIKSPSSSPLRLNTVLTRFFYCVLCQCCRSSLRPAVTCSCNGQCLTGASGWQNSIFPGTRGTRASLIMPGLWSQVHTSNVDPTDVPRPPPRRPTPMAPGWGPKGLRQPCPGHTAWGAQLTDACLHGSPTSSSSLVLFWLLSGSYC